MLTAFRESACEIISFAPMEADLVKKKKKVDGNYNFYLDHVLASGNRHAWRPELECKDKFKDSADADNHLF